MKFQTEYQSLLDALRKVYRSSSPPGSDPLRFFPGARKLLKEHYSEEDKLSPEDALDYLLDAAIDRFGYSARDVFHGVFQYADTTFHHMRAFKVITYTNLYRAVLAINANTSAGHDIIRRRIRLFRNIPEAQELAGQLLEPFTHCDIANVSGGIWPLINMNCGSIDPDQAST